MAYVGRGLVTVRACLLAGGGHSGNTIGDEVVTQLRAEWNHLGKWREVDGSNAGFKV